MKNRGVPPIVFAILIMSEVADAFAQFCFKKSAVALGAVTISGLYDALLFIQGALCEPYLWMGLLTVSAVFISWTVLLSKVDLSVAMPLTSLTYVFVALVSLLFLHEHISLQRWLGIGLILVGVIIVSMSPHKQREHTT